MKVERLIEHLQAYPLDAQVMFADGPKRELTILSIYDSNGVDRRYHKASRITTPLAAKCPIVWIDIGEDDDEK